MTSAGIQHCSKTPSDIYRKIYWRRSDHILHNSRSSQRLRDIHGAVPARGRGRGISNSRARQFLPLHVNNLTLNNFKLLETQTKKKRDAT